VNVLGLILSLYFATLLCTSGLGKLDQPGQFAAILRRQQILPERSLRAVSYLLPLGETVVALALVVGIAPIVTAWVVLILFVGFLIIESTLVVTARGEECGCYGAAYAQEANASSILTSGVLVALAMLYLWTTVQSTPVIFPWRLSVIVPFVIFGCVLTFRIVLRNRRASGRHLPLSFFEQSSGSIPVTASHLRIGDSLPVELGVALQPRAFLIFVRYGCKHCVDLCHQLEGIALGEWSLIAIVGGQPPRLAHGQEDDFMLPSYAQRLEDPEQVWFQAFGVHATPTALAFLNGQLIDDRVGPTISWFTDTAPRRYAREQALLESNA